MSKIKFIDLFAGIGGFHLALKAALKELGSNFTEECVFASEIDKYAKKVYSANFEMNEEKIINIRDIPKKEIPDHEILFAGFPCQTFSNAGKKLGFLDDIRGTLFFDIAEILEEKKPNFFILENVKHLVKHDSGKTFKIIHKTIIDLGYITTEKPLIISATDLGIPQKRERVYILGIKKELVEDLNFIPEPKIEAKKVYESHDIIDENVEEIYYNRIDKKVSKAIKAWGEFLQIVKPMKGRTLPVIWFDYLFTSNEERNLILSNPNISDWRKKYFKDMWYIYDNNSDIIDKWSEKYNVKEWQAREKKFEWQAGIENKNIKECYIQLRQSGIRCRSKKSFPTLVAMVQVPIIFDNKKGKWRYLTLTETGKLQNFYPINSKEISFNFKSYSDLFENSERHDFITQKQFGNSININVVKELIKYLLINFKK